MRKEEKLDEQVHREVTCPAGLRYSTNALPCRQRAGTAPTRKEQREGCVIGAECFLERLEKRSPFPSQMSREGTR